MPLVKDVETAVGECDGLSQKPPATYLVLHSGEIKDLLQYDLRYFHEIKFGNERAG